MKPKRNRRDLRAKAENLARLTPEVDWVWAMFEAEYNRKIQGFQFKARHIEAILKARHARRYCRSIP